MEMIMVLIGKRMSFGKDQSKSSHVDEERSGRISASSSSTRFTKKSKLIYPITFIKFC